MLNHIVMWKIKEDVEDKEKVKLDIKNGLEGLLGKIEELREVRVERYMETTSTHDIALFVKVDNEETLKNYATNPLHVEVVKNYIKPLVYDRVCIDFFEQKGNWMLFKKDEENLSVEIIDIKLDTSTIPSIKEYF